MASAMSLPKKNKKVNPSYPQVFFANISEKNEALFCPMIKKK